MMFIRIICVLNLSFLTIVGMHGQSLVNGSFEIGVEGSVIGGVYWYADELFNEHMANIVGVEPIPTFHHQSGILRYDYQWAGYDEYFFTDTVVPDGEFALMLWSKILDNNEQYATSSVAMELSDPVIYGHYYDLSFFKSKSFAPFVNYELNSGLLDIGVSNNPDSFGQLIYTVDTTDFELFEQHQFEFIAPIDASYITLRARSPQIGQHLVLVDDLILTHLHGPLPDIHVFDDHVDNSSVLEEYSLAEMEVYPNPASDEVRVSGVGGCKELLLVDRLGSEVRRVAVQSDQVRIDVGDLSSGVYFILGEGLKQKKISVLPSK